MLYGDRHRNGWEARLGWYMETDDPDGEVEGVFSPAPPAANKDWWEDVSQHALGHVTVLSTGHDEDTNDTWVVLDCDAIDKAVKLQLEAERKAESKRKTQAIFGGAAPWYSSRRKKPTASGDPSRGPDRKETNDNTAKTTKRTSEDTALARPKKKVRRTKKKQKQEQEVKKKKTKGNRMSDSDD
jgi:hypothetical protein